MRLFSLFDGGIAKLSLTLYERDIGIGYRIVDTASREESSVYWVKKQLQTER
jgi:hypothetical protein